MKLERGKSVNTVKLIEIEPGHCFIIPDSPSVYMRTNAYNRPEPDERQAGVVHLSSGNLDSLDLYTEVVRVVVTAQWEYD